MKKGTIAKIALTILGVAIVGLTALTLIGRNIKSSTAPLFTGEITPFEEGRAIEELSDIYISGNESYRGFGFIMRHLPDYLKAYAEMNVMFYFKVDKTDYLVKGQPIRVDIDEEALGIENGDEVYALTGPVKFSYPGQADVKHIVKLRNASEIEGTDRWKNAKNEIDMMLEEFAQWGDED